MTLTKSLLSVTVVAVLLSGCEMNNTGKGAAIGAATKINVFLLVQLLVR
jgi:PBP1b-binding outer membrane lipoprotein LpoB